MRGQLARGVSVSSTKTKAKAKAALMEALEDRQMLATYYVSPYGSDSKSGTSTSAAWKTISRVNKQTLKAGDKVLFQGGKAFSGGLVVNSNEGGNSYTPVTFGTYGSGRATINSGGVDGLKVLNTAGVHVANLVFNGSGTYVNKTSGIYFGLTASAKKLSNVYIKNVEVKNYGVQGIEFRINGPGGSSISNVRIENASVHHNLQGGIQSISMKHKVNKNWTVRRVKAYENPGSKYTSKVTGSGIYLADIDGGLIEHSIAYNNGKDGAAPVGIWVAGSNRITIQYNESYNNKTRTSTDGGGIDLDWDTHNSTVQYNYTHGNHGPGILLCPATNAGTYNTVRYNISENDGRKNGVGGIQLYGNVQYAKIYNNVVYMSNAYGSSAFRAHDMGASGYVPKYTEVRNNIFYTTGGAKVVNLSSGVASKGSLKFYGNAYHATSSFKIQWGTSGYSSLTSWRTAKGQEKLNGASTGYQGDPKLVKAGYGGTVGNTAALKTALTEYKLQSYSPLINRGVSQPGTLSAVKYDFFGGTSIMGGKYDIGVDEVK
jgi:hypothetical protein